MKWDEAALGDTFQRWKQHKSAYVNLGYYAKAMMQFYNFMFSEMYFNY